MPGVCQVIQHCPTLEQLYLNYNMIFCKGSRLLAEELSRNDSVKVLDISFNSICGVVGASGKQLTEQLKLKKNAAVKAWSDCFRNNKTLMHVDISHNHIGWDDMEVISDGLNENFTILGIHVKGNACWVDSWGFIQPLKGYQFVEML